MDVTSEPPSQCSAYSATQISAWLERICLPKQYARYINTPAAFPKTQEALQDLFRGQITTFPYENLSIHYSNSHQANIKPDVLYTKMMGPGHNGRGGYCMELSIFFYHMLRGLGFSVYMTGVRNRTRIDGVPQGDYHGWSHINNIIYLPCGSKFSADVGFGGDGPTSALLMDKQGHAIQNLGAQEVRLIYSTIPKQQLNGTKLWIYQYRNGREKDWNAFYSFAELEFFEEDFHVLNWWASAKTLHRWTVLVVRFLRVGEPLEFANRSLYPKGQEERLAVVGKVMMINDVVKVNGGGKTRVVHQFTTEVERLHALKKYFGIILTEQEARCIYTWDMALKY